MVTVDKVLKNIIKKKTLKKGDRIKIHRHTGIYIDGKVTFVKGNFVRFESDDMSVSGGTYINEEDDKYLRSNIPRPIEW